MSWLIVKLNKARDGLILDERTGVCRPIVARCGAAGGGGLLLKLVKVVVLSYYPPIYLTNALIFAAQILQQQRILYLGECDPRPIAHRPHGAELPLKV